MIDKVRGHEKSRNMGMIASHLGIVRGTSRNGANVDSIDVEYDHDALSAIVNDIKSMDGIIEVMVDTNEGHLKIGDEILAVVVGGDIREHVFAALMEAVNRIKAESSKKNEHFSD